LCGQYCGGCAGQGRPPSSSAQQGPMPGAARALCPASIETRRGRGTCPMRHPQAPGPIWNRCPGALPANGRWGGGYGRPAARLYAAMKAASGHGPGGRLHQTVQQDPLGFVAGRPDGRGSAAKASNRGPYDGPTTMARPPAARSSIDDEGHCRPTATVADRGRHSWSEYMQGPPETPLNALFLMTMRGRPATTAARQS